MSNEEGIGLFDPLYKRNPMFIPYPNRLELEPTNACNLKCIKCEHTYWKEKEKKMTFEQFKYIIDQFPNLKAISLTGIGHAFQGDDDTFKEEYLKMLRYLKSKQIFVQFFDPFLHIDEKLARDLIEIGVDVIWMSIDGATKKTYNKLHVNSDFDTVIKNVTNIIKLKKEMRSMFPEIHFHYIVQKYNVEEMPQFVDLVNRITKDDPTEQRSIRFTRLIPFKENLWLKPEVSDELIEEIRKKISKSKKLFRIGFPIAEKKPPISCCTSWAVPFITVDGTVYPCCGFTELNKRSEVKKMLEPIFGNVFEKSFKEIWNSKQFKKFKWMIHNNKVPAVCNKFRECPAFATGYIRKNKK